jgi:hypothetical protein
MLFWGALLCIGVLFMATFAQALDSCEFAPLRAPHHFCAERSVQSGAAVCLICASAHTPSLPAPTASVLAPGHITRSCGTLWHPFASALQIFALQVRPPPSL